MLRHEKLDLVNINMKEKKTNQTSAPGQSKQNSVLPNSNHNIYKCKGQTWLFITFHPAVPPSTFSGIYISQEDGSSFCCQPTYQISYYFFFIVRPVLKIIKTNISKYKRAAILYSESSIKTLCRCDNERNNHFPFDLVYLDAQQHKTLKDENSCGKDGYD